MSSAAVEAPILKPKMQALIMQMVGDHGSGGDIYENDEEDNYGGRGG